MMLFSFSPQVILAIGIAVLTTIFLLTNLSVKSKKSTDPLFYGKSNTDRWRYWKITNGFSLISQLCFSSTLKKKFGVETVFTQTLLVNFTNNYKEMAHIKLNVKGSMVLHTCINSSVLSFILKKFIPKKKSI